jgi:hypothetical protein
VLFQDWEHQDPVSGIASDGHQPEDCADCHHDAVRGNCGKVIRRTKDGLNDYVPPNADNKTRQVNHPYNSCGHPVCIYFFISGHRIFSFLNMIDDQ